MTKQAVTIVSVIEQCDFTEQELFKDAFKYGNWRVFTLTNGEVNVPEFVNAKGDISEMKRKIYILLNEVVVQTVSLNIVSEGSMDQSADAAYLAYKEKQGSPL